MLVRDIVSRKRYLDNKLRDLDNYLEKLSLLDITDKVTILNKALEEKFKLLTKIRSHKTLIESLNSETAVKIGDRSVTVSDAVKLRDSFKEQLYTLDGLIRRGDFKVMNVFGLMNQRDEIYEEYIILESVVAKSDCSTRWEADEEN